jgi:putative nucleotidyltransferase with HDIG domain
MPLDSSAIVRAFLASGSLPLSRSISQVQTMLSSADYNACDLAEHLRMDPNLAARVMAVANSAFFSRAPCAAIDDAVNRLGTVQLTRIFAQVLASASMITPYNAYDLPPQAVWRHSIFAAVGAEMAARKKAEDRSAAYMIGLLHLIGMLVIENIWVKKGGVPKFNLPNFEVEWSADEKKLCGFDHPTLGAELLRQLSFPESVINTVAQQYKTPVGPLSSALHLGRTARAFRGVTFKMEPDQAVLSNYDLGSESKLQSFLLDVREEAQRAMQAS